MNSPELKIELCYLTYSHYNPYYIKNQDIYEIFSYFL